ncbi:MAG TPA: tRNA (adenosine(37)-N6)-dimethylallyltransferase MiaA [Patescibacteria group bacterium]|nr:tRNA (adenosine(37)-N6)-dimethylallyltransferase MiaA [Patescibacteria group bacterium]
MTDHRVPITVIAGPTAGGKSARAMALATERNGVIINADSLQVYDTLPILTAQPSDDDKNKTPHCLYGILGARDGCSAAQWRLLAMREIDAAHAAGQLPILCGGTGFYLKALMHGLSPLPDVPPAVRARVMARQKELGNPAFHAELAKLDPVMGAKLNPNDTQRLVRAREVLEATGKSLAEWQALPPEGPPAHYKFALELISPERDVLYARCNARFDTMLKSGGIEEVEALDRRIQAGEVSADAPVTHALGFRPLQAARRGRMPLIDAVERAKAETRQYAKRQVTWFRHQLKPAESEQVA